VIDTRVKPAYDESWEFVTTPALQRTAPQGLCAALRPGNARYLSSQTSSNRKLLYWLLLCGLKFLT
jgi:hypothetical protein